MRIQTNTAANNAYKNLTATGSSLEKQIQKLSSGFRINRASDDAAGLAIANKLRSDGRALMQASRNASQASSMLNIADGAVGTISSMLDRMKELASQAASSNVGTERDKLQDEWNSLTAEIGRVVGSTKYQGTAVLTALAGTAAAAQSAAQSTAPTAGPNVTAVNVTGVTGLVDGDSYTLSHSATGVITLENSGGTVIGTSAAISADQTSITLAGSNGVSGNIVLTVGTGLIVDGTAGGGSNSLTGGEITFTAATAATNGATFLVGASGDYDGQDTVGVNLGSLGTAYDALTATDFSSSADDAVNLAAAQTALSAIDTAIDTTNTFIGKLGAAQSRIEFAQQNLASIMQNTAAAESTIRDADMAQEMTSFTKQQILQQAGTAMLAQANQSSQGVLSLLRG